jgi:integrase
VQSYWEDLLTTAAREQDITAHVLKKRPDAGVVEYNGSYLPHGAGDGGEPVERQRRVQSKETMRISDIRKEYFTHLEKKYEKINTLRKWSRAVDRFVDLMGDLPLQEIKPVLAYAFAQKQCDNNPDVSNSNITDYHTGVSLMLQHCVRKGYIEVNTFQGIRMKEYGKPSQSWQEFTLAELHHIFDHDWRPLERLLLSIIATTGMRLTEAGMLTWERFNDTEVEGVRYFSLIDTQDEQVAVKNEGSARHVPLHPDLVLPPKGLGRLFDYTVDDNGLCSSSAGHIINPALDKLVPHKRKSAHSFRRTLKVMLRDAGVSKEINDIYTGHGSGDVAGKNYGGASIQTRYNAIAKLDLPWLKQT